MQSACWQWYAISMQLCCRSAQAAHHDAVSNSVVAVHHFRQCCGVILFPRQCCDGTFGAAGSKMQSASCCPAQGVAACGCPAGKRTAVSAVPNSVVVVYSMHLNQEHASVFRRISQSGWGCRLNSNTQTQCLVCHFNKCMSRCCLVGCGICILYAAGLGPVRHVGIWCGALAQSDIWDT